MAEAIRVALTLTQDWHGVPGGTAVAANELARELDRFDDVDPVAVVAPGAPTPGFEPPLKGVRLPLGPPLLYDAWTLLRRPAVSRVVPDSDLVHSTIPIAPPPERVPLVATVHDLLPLSMPGSFTRRGAWLMRRGLERLRSEAAVVMVPSRHGRDEFVRHGFDPSRLRVVPLGVHPPRVPSEPEVEAVLDRLGVEPPYVLFVGTEEPRKGLDVLTAAMERLGRAELTLVVAGPAGWGGSSTGEGGRSPVRRVGFLDADELRCVRAGASVCALPSRAEGFGLPALEAMAAGVPLVTTADTPMEEVAAGCARLVPVGDDRALASALAEVLDDGGLAASMVEAGLRRAADFSWSGSAAAVRDVYREVLS